MSQSNPLFRLIHALYRLEKLSTKDVLDFSLKDIKKEISKGFEKFSYRESLKMEQAWANKGIDRDSFAIPISLLSLRGDLSLCEACHFGYPVSMFKYIKGKNYLSLSLMFYGDNSGKYFIKTNNDQIGKLFLNELYLTSLGDNILNDERECPMKGSNYELKCDNCKLKFAKKFCKISGMLKT
jgi:hypothetical protein